MHSGKRFISLFCGLIVFSSTNAQVSDSVLQQPSLHLSSLSSFPDQHTGVGRKPLPIKSFIIPGIMVLYGVSSIESHKLKNWNQDIRYEIYTEHPHTIFPMDNYLQFVPAAAVYGLNAMGIKGKHNLKDR